MFKDKIKTICVIYVISTMVSSTIALLYDNQTDTHWHLIIRLCVITIAIAPLAIFDKMMNKAFGIRLMVHYIVTLALVFLLTWSTQIIEPLSPNAYRDIFLNYSIAYTICVLFGIIYLKLIKKAMLKVFHKAS